MAEGATPEQISEDLGMSRHTLRTHTQFVLSSRRRHTRWTGDWSSDVCSSDVRNLDKGSVDPNTPGRNPGRGFIGYASGDGFATAPDLVRFAEALRDGTVL